MEGVHEILGSGQERGAEWARNPFHAPPILWATPFTALREEKLNCPASVWGARLYKKTRPRRARTGWAELWGRAYIR